MQRTKAFLGATALVRRSSGALISGEPDIGWATFLRYIDDIVSNCLLRAVAVSLGYLLDQVLVTSIMHLQLFFLQTEEKKSPEPLFLAEMELLEPDIIFRPSLNKAIFNNFFTIFTGLIEDIFQMAELVPRIHKVESKVSHEQ